MPLQDAVYDELPWTVQPGAHVAQRSLHCSEACRAARGALACLSGLPRGGSLGLGSPPESRQSRQSRKLKGQHEIWFSDQEFLIPGGELYEIKNCKNTMKHRKLQNSESRINNFLLYAPGDLPLRLMALRSEAVNEGAGEKACRATNCCVALCG